MSVCLCLQAQQAAEVRCAALTAKLTACEAESIQAQQKNSLRACEDAKVSSTTANRISPCHKSASSNKCYIIQKRQLGAICCANMSLLLVLAVERQGHDARHVNPSLHDWFAMWTEMRVPMAMAVRLMQHGS